MRHTSDHPRTDRFVRVSRAHFVGDYCTWCHDDAANHKTAHDENGKAVSHCWSCGCEECDS